MSWEVTVDLGHLWTPESQDIEVSGVYGRGGEEGRGGKLWQEIIHQLTARSVIRDFEKMAEKESDIGHGGRFTGCFFLLINVPLSPNYCASLTIPLFDGFLGSAKRYRTKAIQTSKHCNIICMYTAFTTTDSNPNKGLADMDVQTTGVPPTNTHTQNKLSAQLSSRKFCLHVNDNKISVKNNPDLLIGVMRNQALEFVFSLKPGFMCMQV